MILKTPGLRKVPAAEYSRALGTASGHNSLPMIRLMLPSLRTRGAIGEGTRIYLSHPAPSLHRPHEETAAIAAGDGLITAYDGPEAEL